MTIRRIFHTEDDLMERFSRHFVERWHRLLRAYRDRKKLGAGIDVMKAATLALVFFDAASSGNAEVVNDFDNILCGRGENVVVMDDRPVRIEDEMEKTFIWDTAALMMDTDETLPDRAQWAYDKLDGNTWMAYQLADDYRTANIVDHYAVNHSDFQKTVEVKKLNATVPAFSEEMKSWMMDWARRVGTEQDAMTIARLLKDNVLERYFCQDVDDINIMINDVRKKAERKFINEFKAGSYPTVNQQ